MLMIQLKQKKKRTEYVPFRKAHRCSRVYIQLRYKQKNVQTPVFCLKDKPRHIQLLSLLLADAAAVLLQYKTRRQSHMWHHVE